MKRTILTAAVVAVGLAVAVPVVAQQGGPGGPGGFGPGFGPGFGGPGFGRLCMDTDAKLAGGLAFAERKLKITDQQRPAWTRFADAVRASEPSIQKACETMRPPRRDGERPTPPTLPDRLAHAETLMGIGQETLARIKVPMIELYGQLSAEQKQIADGFLAHGPRGRMEHGGMEHRHHGEPGKPGEQATPKQPG